jgi:hypothetical protein
VQAAVVRFDRHWNRLLISGACQLFSTEIRHKIPFRAYRTCAKGSFSLRQQRKIR